MKKIFLFLWIILPITSSSAQERFRLYDRPWGNPTINLEFGCMLTNEQFSKALLEYVAVDSLLFPNKIIRRKVADSEIIIRKRPEATYYHYEVEITGLNPKTIYTYRFSDGGKQSPWQTSRRTLSRSEIYLPSDTPDRVNISWQDEPAHSQTVTWRTDITVKEAFAEICEAVATTGYDEKNRAFTMKESEINRVPAKTRRFDSQDSVKAHYHSATFAGLKPGTQYAYRVGGNDIWSEWFHFTTADKTGESFSFLYVGDAQNSIKSLWSRTMRKAYSHLPEARFIIHAGDLVGNGVNDWEWGEWFYALSFIHAHVPCLPTPGNHDHFVDQRDKVLKVTEHWKHQFSLPQNGPDPNKGEAYYIDYQDTRIISLNSNLIMAREDSRKAQLAWLEKILSDNPNRWTMVTFHHPLWKEEGNFILQKELQPILEKHKVDLVMLGHIHQYNRGQYRSAIKGQRSPSGTMYVVSVSGPKMYPYSNAGIEADSLLIMDKKLENNQLYQVVTVEKDQIKFESYKVTGELYDAFDILKQPGGKPNRIVNRVAETVVESRSQQVPDKK